MRVFVFVFVFFNGSCVCICAEFSNNGGRTCTIGCVGPTIVLDIPFESFAEKPVLAWKTTGLVLTFGILTHKFLVDTGSCSDHETGHPKWMPCRGGGVQEPSVGKARNVLFAPLLLQLHLMGLEYFP